MGYVCRLPIRRFVMPSGLDFNKKASVPLKRRFMTIMWADCSNASDVWSLNSVGLVSLANRYRHGRQVFSWKEECCTVSLQLLLTLQLHEVQMLGFRKAIFKEAIQVTSAELFKFFKNVTSLIQFIFFWLSFCSATFEVLSIEWTQLFTEST